MTQYVELAIQHVNNRGIIAPVADVFGKYINDQDELYMSLYRFDKDLVDHFRIRRTIKLFKGKYYLPYILFDIDKGEANDADLLIYVNQFIEELDLPEEHIQPWFSGRGYHIVVPNLLGLEPSHDLPAIMKATMGKHFPEADNIYDGARIIRVGYTKNIKSGLYKTPFSVDELRNFSAEDVLGMSSAVRRNFQHIPFATDIKPIWADKVTTEGVKEYNRVLSFKKSDDVSVPAKMPNGTAEKEMNGVVTCVQKIFNEGPVEGTRHVNMIRMISGYRRHGIPREAVHSIMRDWAVGKDMTEYEVKIQVNNIYDKGYRFGCDDHVLAKYCDSRCIFFTGKNSTLHGQDSTSMEASFANYAKQDFAQTAINLYDYYHSIGNDWMMYPKEFIVVTGITGLGKTAWVQNLMVMVNTFKTLFFSLELHRDLAYRRFIQMAHDMTKHEVFEYYQKQDTGLGDAIRHIEIITATPELSALERMVAETKPKLVVVDTTDEISIQGMKSFDKDVQVALGLKHIAEKFNIIVIGIHHTDKATLRGGKVSLASLKGTSAYVQKADKVLAINGTAKHLYRSLDALKARDEKEISIPFELVRKSFWYKEIKRGEVDER
ncbi:MAG: AAA family ATPase [Candidatus Brocadiales bacterium]|nr:AAA family ATPase [Candidatus Brocadiales bacterium]